MAPGNSNVSLLQLYKQPPTPRREQASNGLRLAALRVYSALGPPRPLIISSPISGESTSSMLRKRGDQNNLSRSAPTLAACLLIEAHRPPFVKTRCARPFHTNRRDRRFFAPKERRKRGVSLRRFLSRREWHHLFFSPPSGKARIFMRSGGHVVRRSQSSYCGVAKSSSIMVSTCNVSQ